MIAFKLAYRNLKGAGLRTWLNVIVLSFSFVVIIWQQGLLEGWNRQARRDKIDWEIGGGQYWHPRYDPYDPFTVEESHGPVPENFKAKIEQRVLTPILIAQATIYPEGRIQSVLLKGINPDQTILKIPTETLRIQMDEIPAVIGSRMARSTNFKVGDFFTVRWRDVNGTFDAAEAKIVGIMKTNVPTIDNGQIWIPMDRLCEMMQVKNEATVLVAAPESRDNPIRVDGWSFQNQNFLLKDITEMIRVKSISGSMMYILLLFLAMLAIFDTQVLSIFRRRKEIGTLIALGMTRGRVVRLFTVEGAMHGILAAALAAVYGIPLLTLQAVKGFAMPEISDSMGLAIAERIFPAYSAVLVLGTTLLVLAAVTVVSYIPARKIAKLKPTDAIKGKMS